MFCVYKHTCPNGKVYIGITCRNVKYRWNNGKGYISNKHFYSAILKYGWENIEHEILYENLTKEEAEQKEIELILFYKSNNRSYGYNNDNGGSHKGRVSQATKEKLRIAYYNMSEEQKIKMKRHRKGMLGKHHSKETKQIMREKAIGRKMTDEAKEKNRLAHLGKKQSLEAIEKRRKAMIGRKMSDETKKKLSLAKKGKPNNRLGVKLSKETKLKIAKANYKKVYCYETNKIYQSIQQTEKELNITNVSLVCNGKLKSIKGYHFKFV